MVINNGSLTLAEPLMYTPNSGNFNNSTGNAKKLLNCFSGHFFLKTDAAEQVFIFIQQKNQMQELFFEAPNDIFISCACTAISSDIEYSSQAIKLDCESLYTSSRFDFITGAQNLRCWGSISTKNSGKIWFNHTRNGVGNKYTAQQFLQWITTSMWNRMVVTDNNVMKLEMRFLLIFSSPEPKALR